MKTSTLQGTQKQFEHLYKAITLEDKDKDLIPQEVETRVYEVQFFDGRVFRIFCRGKNQKKRLRELTDNLEVKVIELSNGIHTIKEFEDIFYI